MSTISPQLRTTMEASASYGEGNSTKFRVHSSRPQELGVPFSTWRIFVSTKTMSCSNPGKWSSKMMSR